jgi:hypothetical protein
MKKKESLKERVTELEAEVRFLKWLVDKHVYEDKPVWYFTEVTPKPDPLTGWRIT